MCIRDRAGDYSPSLPRRPHRRKPHRRVADQRHGQRLVSGRNSAGDCPLESAHNSTCRNRRGIERKSPLGDLVVPEQVIAYEAGKLGADNPETRYAVFRACLLYTSDAADERSSVDLGGRRIIKKKIRTDT